MWSRVFLPPELGSPAQSFVRATRGETPRRSPRVGLDGIQSDARRFQVPAGRSFGRACRRAVAALRPIATRAGAGPGGGVGILRCAWRARGVIAHPAALPK